MLFVFVRLSSIYIVLYSRKVPYTLLQFSCTSNALYTYFCIYIWPIVDMPHLQLNLRSTPFDICCPSLSSNQVEDRLGSGFWCENYPDLSELVYERLSFCSSAPDVGGVFLIERPLVNINRSLRSSLTLLYMLVLSYKRTTNLSRSLVNNNNVIY